MLCTKMPWNSWASSSLNPVMLFSAMELTSSLHARPYGRFTAVIPHGGVAQQGVATLNRRSNVDGPSRGMHADILPASCDVIGIVHTTQI
jgi:hypothetical protein